MNKQMIRFFFAFLSALSLAGTLPNRLAAQDLPDIIKGTFNSKYAGVKVISYLPLSALHSVIFEEANTIKVSKFDAAGAWIETVTALNPQTTPSKVADYLGEKHAGKQHHVRKVEDKNGTTTFVAFVNETTAVRFDKDGNLIKEEAIDPLDSELLSQIK
jgi:hypothetical protein